MQVFWGSVSCPVNGAEVTSQLTVVEATDEGAPLRYLMSYSVLLWLEGSGQSDLSARELAFRAALMVQNQDFILKTDAGLTSSSAILARNTASGTRVISIATPEAQGGEYVNRRTISFVVTGEYHVANSARAVVSWRETVSITGTGGPRRMWRFPLNAPAVRQTVTPYSLVRVVQSGDAVGYRARPTKPAPLFPDYLVHDAVATSIASPRYMGPGKPFIEWPVSWSYTFERGDGPLIAVPNIPPGVI